MLPNIYIPTLGRIDKHTTYSLLPRFLQERVTFVVRGEEAHGFTKFNTKILICPEWVCDSGTTRRFIQESAGDSYHWVMDDDIRSVSERGGGIADWYELLTEIEKYKNRGFRCLGFDDLPSPRPDDAHDWSS